MKTTNLLLPISLASAMIAGPCREVRARDGVEHVVFNEGQVWAIQGGTADLLKKDLELPHNILVSTNGTFRVGTHSPRPFVEGQILGADGMLLSPNGRIEPVLDHIGLDAGKTVSSVNGNDGLVNQDISLGPDKKLTTDRALVGNDRSWMRVIDGMLFTPDGKSIPAVDTISLQKGKVVVQKEGTQIVVGFGRSIMMNEGTKVFGDGTVISRDGTTTQLTEGQIITIQGVVKLR